MTHSTADWKGTCTVHTVPPADHNFSVHFCFPLLSFSCTVYIGHSIGLKFSVHTFFWHFQSGKCSSSPGKCMWKSHILFFPVQQRKIVAKKLIRFTYFLLHPLGVRNSVCLQKGVTTRHIQFVRCLCTFYIRLYDTIELLSLWWREKWWWFPFSCIIVMCTLFINRIPWNASMQLLSSSVRTCHQHHSHYQHIAGGTWITFPLL